jgi:hypothetical protein
MVIVAPPGIPLRMLELGTVRAARTPRLMWNFPQRSIIVYGSERHWVCQLLDSRSKAHESIWIARAPSEEG